MDANKTYGEKSLMSIKQECFEQYWTSPKGSTPQSSSSTATKHEKQYKLDEPDMRATAGEVRASS